MSNNECWRRPTMQERVASLSHDACAITQNVLHLYAPRTSHEFVYFEDRGEAWWEYHHIVGPTKQALDVTMHSEQFPTQTYQFRLEPNAAVYLLTPSSSPGKSDRPSSHHQTPDQPPTPVDFFDRLLEASVDEYLSHLPCTQETKVLPLSMGSTEPGDVFTQVILASRTQNDITVNSLNHQAFFNGWDGQRTRLSQKNWDFTRGEMRVSIDQQPIDGLTPEQLIYYQKEGVDHLKMIQDLVIAELNTPRSPGSGGEGDDMLPH